MDEIGKLIPNDIYIRGVNLEKELGIKEIAWGYTCIIKILDILFEYGYVVLGGDVYCQIDKKVETTYDSWYFNKKNFDTDSEESIKKAVDFVSAYYNKNGKDYIYSIVAEKQVSYER